MSGRSRIEHRHHSERGDGIRRNLTVVKVRRTTAGMPDLRLTVRPLGDLAFAGPHPAILAGVTIERSGTASVIGKNREFLLRQAVRLAHATDNGFKTVTMVGRLTPVTEAQTVPVRREDGCSLEIIVARGRPAVVTFGTSMRPLTF